MLGEFGGADSDDEDDMTSEEERVREMEAQNLQGTKSLSEKKKKKRENSSPNYVRLFVQNCAMSPTFVKKAGLTHRFPF